LSDSIAILDGGSFVLPYDYQLVRALAARGAAVEFYGSRTRYNGEFLEAMRQLGGVTVHERGVSGTVSSRWRGLAAYIGLLVTLLWRSRRHRLVDVQFSAWWPGDLLVLALLRRKLVFSVHNAVPHGYAGMRHGPTLWLARLARSLVFVSEATREEFLRRYGRHFDAKAVVMPHGLLPAAPGLDPVEYSARRAAPREIVFWSTVRSYKGVEIFAELARSPALRSRGLALRVAGKWDRELLPLRDELAALGVRIDDGYLDRDALLCLLAEDVVFLLPYRDASQSGALYTLLSHACVFICADAGDLGAFMRRFGLTGLLLRDRTAPAVVECLEYLQAHRDEVLEALRAAQRQFDWQRVIESFPGLMP
jgi:hypothetical protein